MITQVEIDALVARLRSRLGGVSTPMMKGDNLSITLASAFENPDQEQDEIGWTPDALAGSDEVLDAIHEHYASAIVSLQGELARCHEANVLIREQQKEDYARADKAEAELAAMKKERDRLAEAVEYAHAHGFEWPSDPMPRAQAEALSTDQPRGVRVTEGWRIERMLQIIGEAFGLVQAMDRDADREEIARCKSNLIAVFSYEDWTLPADFDEVERLLKAPEPTAALQEAPAPATERRETVTDAQLDRMYPYLPIGSRQELRAALEAASVSEAKPVAWRMRSIINGKPTWWQVTTEQWLADKRRDEGDEVEPLFLAALHPRKD